MGRINLNPRLAKSGRCYDVVEIARLYGVHPHTVRAWRKAGLTPIDDGRPVLFLGSALQAFLAGRRSAQKRPCPPGHLYCLRCRDPRRPAPASVEYWDEQDRPGMLRALCSDCGARMNRKANRREISSLLPGMAVTYALAPASIEACVTPRSNADNIHDRGAPRNERDPEGGQPVSPAVGLDPGGGPARER